MAAAKSTAAQAHSGLAASWWWGGDRSLPPLGEFEDRYHAGPDWGRVTVCWGGPLPPMNPCCPLLCAQVRSQEMCARCHPPPHPGRWLGACCDARGVLPLGALLQQQHEYTGWTVLFIILYPTWGTTAGPYLYYLIFLIISIVLIFIIFSCCSLCTGILLILLIYPSTFWDTIFWILPNSHAVQVKVVDVLPALCKLSTFM
jgi:hypothetical protein